MKEKINVLQVVGEPVGGIRKHVHSILLGLNEAEFNQSYAYSMNVEDAQFRREMAAIEEKVHHRTLKLRIKKRPSLWDIYNIGLLLNFVRKNEIDIIHGHGAKGGLYARVVAGLSHKKAVYTPHGGVVHKMFSPWMDAIYTRVERFLLDKTDCLLFESNYTAQAFQHKIKKMPKCWIVNHNGVSKADLNAIAAQAEKITWHDEHPERPKIGVFGMLRYQKGQQYAIQAVEKLKNQGVLVELHLFGQGKDLSKLQKLAVSLNIEPHVIFHGDVAETEFYMSKMDVIVIPSLFESFGYVAVEAFALKKPVIATAVGGLLEVVDETCGSLVASADPEALAMAIKQLVLNPSLGRQYAEKGFEKFNHQFTLDRMQKTLTGTYRSLMS